MIAFFSVWGAPRLDEIRNSSRLGCRVAGLGWFSGLNLASDGKKECTHI